MPFGLKDIKRETTDHVKGAYGLLAMIHKVAYSFIYADDDIFFRFKVYFIHATGKKKKSVFGSFGLVSEKLYVFSRIRRAKLPASHIDFRKKFKDITNMMWELKV